MSDPDLTVSDVANELRIRRETVVDFITSGELEACDVSPPSAKRKAYRVTREALDEFKANRSAKQTTNKTKRKPSTKRQAGFVEYF